MKHKEEDIQIDIQQESIDKNSSGAFESTVNTSFFCTNDKAFEIIDNIEIFQYMVKQYDMLNQSNEDSQIKKTIILMLNNELFMHDLIDYYSISIQDVLKILYQQYSGIFKGPFLKKIRGIVEAKNYINCH